MKWSPAQLSKVTFSEMARNVALRTLAPDVGYPVFRPGADVGGAILLIWLVTWASGRFRPVPNWIDRAGRVLGTAWLALTLLADLSNAYIAN
jgi:hypothetical protein